MSNIEITLPDGSKQPVAAGTRPIDIARSISPRLADAAIVARVDGELYDLTRPLEKDASLQILTAKDAESLGVYRHSSAHLLAAAVLELFPETKLGIGPAIDNGFYYDFDRAAPFTPEDLEKIEKKMWEIQSRDLPYERIYTRKDEGLKKYADAWMKCELIDERAGEVFSEYTLGPHFIDFCRGPHVPSTTSSCSAFTARPFSRKRSWMPISSRWRRPRSATTASWARNWTCSASRSWPVRASSSSTPRAASSASSLKTGCATST
jgi:threonyl-tRNA synthetase